MLMLTSVSVIFVASVLFQARSIQSKVCPEKCICTEKMVFCPSKRLNMVPQIDNKRITYLNLPGNKIKEIKRDTFKEFKDVTRIDLSFNEISLVEEFAFHGPLNLESLILHKNQIKMLPQEIFTEHSENLKVLTLSNNKLMSLPISIEKLVNAKTIDLSGNPLHCGCDLRFFAVTLKSLEYPKTYASCASPAEVKGQNLDSIKFDEFCQNMKETALNPPRFIQQLEDVKVAEGDEARFDCLVNEPDQAKIMWYFQFNDTSYQSYYFRQQILIIKEVHLFHKGIISCTAINNAGSITSSAMLTIVRSQKPFFVEGPISISAPRGSKVEFRCRANGYPKPKISWLWIAHSIVKLETEGKFTVRKNLLIIDNVTEAETVGRFTCHASNLVGSAQVSGLITLENKNMMGDGKAKTLKGSLQIKKERLNEIIKDATEKINAAFKKTVERLRDPNRRRTDIQSLFRQPTQAALELAKASEVYEKVIDDLTAILRENKVSLNVSKSLYEDVDLNSVLDEEQLAIISQLSGCQRSIEELHCDQQLCFHKKYRSIDGKCNNLIYPRRGSALSPFYRLLKPEYENGINTPIGWSPGRLYFGYPKPSARLVSTKLLRANKVTPDPHLTSMVMQWGQFLDHDLDLTPVDAATSRFSDGLGCNETCVNDAPCFPILIPPDDMRIRRPCIGFSRSIPTCGSGQSSIIFGKLHYREQINQITSFIDGSNVYGSDYIDAIELRDTTYNEGKLRVGPTTAINRRLLPFNVRGQIDCQIDPEKAHVSCFKAGDHRSNENLGLLTMHTIWMREHNRIAEELRKLNSHWSGDKLYYESRKIVGAIMQHITYTQWLPLVIGNEGMNIMRKYSGYNDSVDPTISNVFASAAMRFGHTLINPILFRLNENFETIPEGNLPLHKAFFAPDKIMEDGGLDPILRGLYSKNVKAVKPEEPMNTELIEKLFAMAHEVALDLGALNIQRGRDHGIPSYNSWRKLCGLKQGESFDDFSKEITSAEIREKMRQVYGHPGSVDLFAGAVLEKKTDGLMGPTFRCLLIDQFERLRDGDRFWYESTDQFTPAQLSQLKKASLARVVCDNGDNITRVQENIFLLPKTHMGFMECNKIMKLNMIPWKECRDSGEDGNDDNIFNLPSRSKRSVSNDDSPNVSKIDRATMKELKKKFDELENMFKKLKKEL